MITEKRLLRLVLVTLLCSVTVELPASPPQSGAMPVLSVRDYGARSDSTLCTKGIQSAIDAAAAQGGGVVYFPPGNYLCGSLFLKSNITLYLENGCVVWGSTDIEDYTPVGEERPEFDARHERHFLYADNCENVAIKGQGVIDGNGPLFYPAGWRDMNETELREAMLNQQGYSSRPGHHIVFRNCRNLVIEDVTLRYSPTWMLSIGGCENVRLRGLVIRQGVFEDDGPNTDGIAVSSTNVRISGCEIITGDDCLVLSGRDIVVTNCVLTTTESAFVFGGGENINISNCAVYDAGCCLNMRIHRERTLDGLTVNNLTYKLDRQEGGNLIFARIKPIELRTAVQSYAQKWGIKADPPSGPPGVLKNLTFSNINAMSDGAVFMDGLEDRDIENVTFSNIRYIMRGARKHENNADPQHPYTVFGHKSSTYGMYFRYIRNLKLKDVEFIWNTPEQAEWGSAIRCRYAEDVEIDGFSGRQSLGSDQPAITLTDVQNAFIHSSRVPADAGTFLRIDGSTRNVTLTGNDLGLATKAVTAGPGADLKEVFESGNRPPRQ